MPDERAVKAVMEILCPGFGPPILINHDESYPDEAQLQELATQIVEAVTAALSDGSERDK